MFFEPKAFNVRFLILVAFLAFFPLAPLQDFQDLAKTPSVTSHFYQI